ncbi:hypothetical protein VAEU17_4400311 [Vibrio aestuarianus]|nr:hypothetical protein VAEU17_4400311 [Vibrio aestuarianus]
MEQSSLECRYAGLNASQMEIFHALQITAHLGSAQRQTPNYKMQLGVRAHLRSNKTGLAQKQAKYAAATQQQRICGEEANADLTTSPPLLFFEFALK